MPSAKWTQRSPGPTAAAKTNSWKKPSFRKIFRRLFEAVVEQCVQAGLVSGRLVVTDSTHVKANASRASEHLVEVTGKPGAYWERLDAYEEKGLEELEHIHYHVIPIQSAAAVLRYTPQ